MVENTNHNSLYSGYGVGNRENIKEGVYMKQILRGVLGFLSAILMLFSGFATIIIYLGSIKIAYEVSGTTSAIVTAILIPFAQIFWLFKISMLNGLVNGYSEMFLWAIGFGLVGYTMFWFVRRERRVS